MTIYSETKLIIKVYIFGEHSINTRNNSPIAAINHRVPVQWEKEIDDQIDNLLKNGIRKPSNSPWCSRKVPITKKDGRLRLCIDYRPLNAITIKDKYPIPRIADILNALYQANYFSTLDATSGYHQVPRTPNIPKDEPLLERGTL